MTIRRGERYAIIGPNGSGKSTLLKTFAGRLQPLAGTITYGHNVQVGYYDQTLGDLNPAGNVIDEVWNLDHSQTEEQVRSYLAQFSFFDDDVFKKTRDLSGGEKGRLALAKIIYPGGNVMLLDEPTNHLDVYTREALEEALERFTGALIVVSHDRYFIDRVAEHIILVEDGHAEVFDGNYSDLRGAVEDGERRSRAKAEVVPSYRTLLPTRSPANRRHARQADARGTEEAREADQEDRRGDRRSRIAHRLGGARARAQRSAALFRGGLPRRRAQQEDPVAERRPESDGRSAVRQVGSAGEREGRVGGSAGW